jgi:hypothetical protein
MHDRVLGRYLRLKTTIRVAHLALQSGNRPERPSISVVSLLLGLSEASVLPGRALDDALPNMVSVDVDEFYSSFVGDCTVQFALKI